MSLIILSGGLDSATCLAIAASKSDRLLCVTFDYGQRHQRELLSAAQLADHYGAEQKVIGFDARAWGGSSLTSNAPLPTGRTPEEMTGDIPSTYVPARNMIFLSFALSIAEASGLGEVYIGVNALDYSGYPDCRPEFIEAFQQAAAVGQACGVADHPIKIETPLIGLSKSEIVALGASLGVPVELSWSCYTGGERPCGQCDSCLLRAKGFAEAGMEDPLCRL